MPIVSEESLSFVLGEEVLYVDESVLIKKTGRYLSVRTVSGTYEYEIHFLANKCKEWALNKHGYIINTYIIPNPKRAFCIITSYEGPEHNAIEAPTEPETIFKACEWINHNKLKDAS